MKKKKKKPAFPFGIKSEDVNKVNEIAGKLYPAIGLELFKIQKEYAQLEPQLFSAAMLVAIVGIIKGFGDQTERALSCIHNLVGKKNE